NKTAEILISTDSGSPIEIVKESSESKRTFDEFKYKDEVLEEAEEFFTKEISDDKIFWNLWKNYQSLAFTSPTWRNYRPENSS
ncbi:2487_t:CDS:1, partial [Gigaspora margarita]